MKKTITKYEVIIRFLVITLSFFLAYFSEESERKIISTIGFFIAFFVIIYLHKHFFPFVTLAIACYLMADIQELWNEKYTYLPITRFLWTAGNVLLPIGMLTFLYRIIFKYKIIENEEY
mgnify:CR=1 FL=1